MPPSSNFLCSDNPSQPAPWMKALFLSQLELQAVVTDHCSFPKNCLAFSTEIFAQQEIPPQNAKSYGFGNGLRKKHKIYKVEKN